MLAHLLDEDPAGGCEEVSLDPTLAAARGDDPGVLAQLAYEAAPHGKAEDCWIPARRRRAPEHCDFQT
jgi:hypothetical protein